MSHLKKLGKYGEIEVIELVNCPNCGKELMLLPEDYPLYDIQCKACLFRAQIKTKNSKPSNTVPGSTWNVMEKVLKAGFLTPPLIVNFKWGNKQKIIFYPFVPKTNLKKRQVIVKAPHRKLHMFNYVNLNELPSIILYSK